MDYVVTGCNSASLEWVGSLLTELSPDCGRQAVYGLQVDTARADQVAGDVSWLAVPRLDTASLRVLRVVEDPKATVKRLLKTGFLSRINGPPEGMAVDPYTRFALEHQPEIGEAGDTLGRLIRYAAGWDASVLDAPVLKADDPEQRTPARLALVLRDLTGRQVDAEGVEQAAAHAPASRGVRRKIKLRWADILDHSDGYRLAERAEQLGYPVG